MGSPVSPFSHLRVSSSFVGTCGSTCTLWMRSHHSTGMRLLSTGAPQCKPMFQSRSRYCEAFFSKTMQLIAAYHREPAIVPIKQSSRAATLRDRLTHLAEPLGESKAGAAYQPVRQGTARDVVSRMNAPDPIIRMGSLSWTVFPVAGPAMLPILFHGLCSRASTRLKRSFLQQCWTKRLLFQDSTDNKANSPRWSTHAICPKREPSRSLTLIITSHTNALMCWQTHIGAIYVAISRVAGQWKTHLDVAMWVAMWESALNIRRRGPSC
jgi:hypothetical protein